MAAAPLPAQLSDMKTTEGWIWREVQAGRIADLNARCGTEALDIQKRDDARWKTACRRVDPDLLRGLLMQPDLSALTPRGVLIRGAYVSGDLDLMRARVRTPFVGVEQSW